MMIISEGMRMFGRNIKIKLSGYERFKGDDEGICKEIIGKCFVRKHGYFRASITNYGFYSRDFGWCVAALMNLGYKKEVENTLRYALRIFSIYDGIKVSINPGGKAFNFPNIYSPDSVAYIFRSLRIAEAKKLIMEYKDFLNNEIIVFENTVLDKNKGVVKKENFSGMRDYAIRQGSCYDMIMACMLNDEIDKINKMMKKNILDNTLSKYPLKKNLMKYFWNGNYFKDALDDDNITGHCNVYPYWLGVVSDKGTMNKSLSAINKAGLDKPFPLKYSNIHDTEFILMEFLVSGWEHDTVWAMLGMAYIDVLSRIDQDKAKYYLKTYKALIERNKAFIEVYEKNGKPYSSVFYSAETGMLWAAMYLDLKEKLNIE
jgi:hypothetical protein